MEAATAGAPAAAEAGESQVQAQEAEAQEQAPEVGIQEWQQGVDARLGESLDSIRELANVVQTRLPEPQAEPEPDFNEQFQALFEETGGFPDANQLSSLMEQSNKQAIEKALAPFQQQMDQFQQQMTAQELGALQSKFPELADPKRGQDGQTNVDRLADQVVTRADEWGVPHLANNAGFVEMVHRDMQSRSRAQQETPAGQGSIPQIETGGGAAPASSGGDEWGEFLNRRGTKPVW